MSTLTAGVVNMLLWLLYHLIENVYISRIVLLEFSTGEQAARAPGSPPRTFDRPICSQQRQITFPAFAPLAKDTKIREGRKV